MKNLRVRVLLLAVISGLFCTACSRVDTPEIPKQSVDKKQSTPKLCDTNLQTAGDISLRVSIKDGQTVFHQGEIIALTTSYSAQTKRKYSVWEGSAIGTPVFGDGELYCLSPDVGVKDDLFEGAIWPGIAGGGSVSLGMFDPGTKTSLDHLELNNPHTVVPSGKSLPAGKYSLRVISQRVTPAVKDIFQKPPRERVSVISNTVQFEVHADPEWQAQQFTQEEKILNSPNATRRQKFDAIHKLRFLDTETSVRELTHHFHSLTDSSDQLGQWEILYAMFGTRHRSEAIEEMKTAVPGRHRSITPDFAKLLVALEMQADPRLRLPSQDEVDRDTLLKTTSANKAEFDRKVREVLQSVAPAGGLRTSDRQLGP